jgi:tetratricopeptide (TPR) repeat protein
MLGWLAYLEDDAETSLEYYRQADAIEPRSAKIKHHLGLALGRLERWPEAMAEFQTALEIDPNFSDACLSLSQAYQKQKQPAEFLRLALRAANLTRFENLDALLNLADAYAENGRNSQATETASRALAIAEQTNPALVPQLRAQIQEFQLKSLRRGK